MRFLSITSTRMPVLTLLVLAIISLLLARHQQQRLVQAQVRLHPAEQVRSQMQHMNGLLTARLDAAPSPARPLHDIVPAVLEKLRTADRYDVALVSITTAQGRTIENKALDRLATPLPGSRQLKQLRLQVTGHYRRYEGLLQYFDQLDMLPAAIDAIHIDRDQLVFNVAIYGT